MSLTAEEQRVVAASIGLVHLIARQLGVAPRHPHYDDVVQAGLMGLCIAVPRFDPSRGVKLSSYAAWWIRREMYVAMGSYSAVRATRYGRRVHGAPVVTEMVEIDHLPRWRAERLVGSVTVVEDAGERLDKLVELAKLTDGERRVLAGRRDGMTLDALGLEFGVSRERIHQIEFGVVGKLREVATGRRPESWRLSRLKRRRVACGTRRSW